MRSALAWSVSELIRLVEGTCLVFATLDMVVFWEEGGERCCMFRMELDNSQILQSLSVTVCSILAYALCFQSDW